MLELVEQAQTAELRGFFRPCLFSSGAQQRRLSRAACVRCALRCQVIRASRKSALVTLFPPCAKAWQKGAKAGNPSSFFAFWDCGFQLAGLKAKVLEAGGNTWHFPWH